jgi:hypothetical protein
MFQPDNAHTQEALLKVYEFMFSEMQEFRSTITTIALAFNSALLLLLGWSISKSLSLSILQKELVSIGVLLLTLLILRLCRIIQAYFLSIAQVVNRFDRIYRLHEPGIYLESESIFPEKWKDFGTDTWKEPVFDAALHSSVVIPTFAIIAMWICV